PVVPVGLIGTEKLQPAGSKGFRPAKFHIHYGEPLHFDQLGRKHPLPQRRQATDRIVDAIAELSGQQRVDSYNQLPPDAK
ncbi:lysophospholipid acyltransferase family protein, partial [Glutamicibacter halophytocola]